MKAISAYFSGLIFAFGLGLSGMTQTQKVRGFLDIFGEWNGALLGVMIGAIGTHALFYQLIKRRSRPVLDEKFHLPQNKTIDKKLILGAAIFGLGWGWAGICPGPGIVGMGALEERFFWFVGAMLIGMAVFKWVDKKL